MYSRCLLANLDLVLGESVHDIVHRNGSTGASSPRRRLDGQPAAEAESVSDGIHNVPYSRDVFIRGQNNQKLTPTSLGPIRDMALSAGEVRGLTLLLFTCTKHFIFYFFALVSNHFLDSLTPPIGRGFKYYFNKDNE